MSEPGRAPDDHSTSELRPIHPITAAPPASSPAASAAAAADAAAEVRRCPVRISLARPRPGLAHDPSLRQPPFPGAFPMH